MKNVILIGDSISMGYRYLVKQAFDGVANIYFPDENCRFASYVLRNLYDWRAEFGCGSEVDLIHWNAGLWDDLILPDGKHHVHIDRYAEDIERICETMKILFPKAKTVFATSTPVLENVYERRFEYYRRLNRDTERYNAVASEIVKKHGGDINDLYTLLKDFPESYHSDMTHFYTKEATILLTDKVIACIEEKCGLKAKKLDYEKLSSDCRKIVGI